MSPRSRTRVNAAAVIPVCAEVRTWRVWLAGHSGVTKNWGSLVNNAVGPALPMVPSSSSVSPGTQRGRSCLPCSTLARCPLHCFYCSSRFGSSTGGLMMRKRSTLGLDRARELAAREDGLAVFVTIRADGSAQASVVNAGVLNHPVTGEPVVGFVAQGEVRKLTNLRVRPSVTGCFDQAGSGWPSRPTRRWPAPTIFLKGSSPATFRGCSGRSMPLPSAAPRATGPSWTRSRRSSATPLSQFAPPAYTRTRGIARLVGGRSKTSP